MHARPVVWFVDDLPSNLTAFASAHSEAFSVRTFSDPSEVLGLLAAGERPDALLCDVFFYETPDRAWDIEHRIADEAAKLRQTAHDIAADADRYLAGIDLMEAVTAKFKGSPPFPVYAYTSKGPYLLQQCAWERIVQSGAKVLLKHRFGPDSERTLIQRDIDFMREQRSFGVRLRRYFKTIIITMGLLGAILGVILDRLVQWFIG